MTPDKFTPLPKKELAVIIPEVLTLEFDFNVFAKSALVALGAITCCEYERIFHSEFPTPTIQSPGYAVEIPILI